MRLDPRNPDHLAQVEALAARLRAEYGDEPNILQIAPGLRVAAGAAVPDELVLTFFVRRKMSPEELEGRGARAIPREVDGVATDVEPTLQAPLASALDKRRERRDPLMGGIAIGNGNIQWHFGTLGGIVFDEVSGEARGLTNEHVLVDLNEGVTGDPVIQPAPPRVEDFIEIDFTPDCCPVGPIFFIETGGPISGFLAWCAVVAGIVALSDVRDPFRRGEDATIPAPDEGTLREQVDVAIKYRDFPIPGTPYKVDVSWDYRRFTTGATHGHHVDETQQNEHFLTLQRLLTDRTEYRRGDVVHLLALLAAPAKKRRCDAFHAVGYLVPGAPEQQGRSKSVVLHPVSSSESAAIARFFPDLQGQEPLIRCDNYRDLKADLTLPPGFTHGGFRYDSATPSTPLRTVDWIPAGSPDGEIEIAFQKNGMSIGLPAPADFVTVDVAQFTNDQIKAEARNASGSVVAGAATPDIQHVVNRLELSGSGIITVFLTGGGGEGVLVRVCYGNRIDERPCFYYGRTVIGATDPLGPWRTHLFAQTLNDVPPGTDPEVAAQTIGGMPVTRNFESAGTGEVHPYGDGCIFRPFVDGNITVLS